jgi:hypothetical protein
MHMHVRVGEHAAGSVKQLYVVGVPDPNIAISQYCVAVSHVAIGPQGRPPSGPQFFVGWVIP